MVAGDLDRAPRLVQEVHRLAERVLDVRHCTVQVEPPGFVEHDPCAA